MLKRARWRALLILALSFIASAHPLPQMGSIEGRVVRAGMNTPIDGARVILGRMGQNISEWDEDFEATDSAQDGGFSFKELEPGTYFIRAKKDGYAEQIHGMAETGLYALLAGTRGSLPTEQTLRTLATLFRVEKNSTFRSAVIALTPSGVISGRLLGSDGRALPGVQIKLLTDTYTGGGVKMPAPLEDESASTDDRGEFRLFDVPPGTYYLVASPSGDDNKYSRTLYPGVVDFERAVSIAVRSGQEVRLPGFSLQPPAPVFSVSGRLVERRTTPKSLQNFTVRFISRRPTGAADFDEGPRAQLSPDGSFVVDGIAPGDYWISVSGGLVGEDVAGVVPIRVTGPTVGVEVPVADQVTLKGRLVFDSPQPPRAADLARIEVGLELAEVSLSLLAVLGPEPVHPTPDGAFSLPPAYGSEFRVFAMHLPPDMYLRDVKFRGRSGIHQLISLEGPRSDLLEIHVGTRGGQISGLLLDEQGKPRPNVRAALVPRGVNPHPDHFKTNYSDESGRYVIRGIAPGDYTLLAWDEPETSYFNSEYVSRFLSKGRDVRVTEGSTEVFNLQVIPRS